jgi:hypothetical protein
MELWNVNESQLLQRIRLHWSPLCHLLHLESNTTLGIPDINFAYQGKDIWVELKVLRGEHIYVEKFQPQFHVTRNRYGGHCYILAGNTKEVKIVQIKEPSDIWKGDDVGKFIKFNVQDLPLVIQYTKPFDWREMFMQFMEKIE